MFFFISDQSQFNINFILVQLISSYCYSSHIVFHHIVHICGLMFNKATCMYTKLCVAYSNVYRRIIGYTCRDSATKQCLQFYQWSAVDKYQYSQ